MKYKKKTKEGEMAACWHVEDRKQKATEREQIFPNEELNSRKKQESELK